MTDKVMFLTIIPALLLVIMLGWVIILSRGGRGVNLKLRGLGLQLSVDTFSDGGSHPHRRADDCKEVGCAQTNL